MVHLYKILVYGFLLFKGGWIIASNVPALLDSAQKYRAYSLTDSTYALRVKNNAVFSQFLQALIKEKKAQILPDLDSILQIAYLVSNDKKLEVFSWRIEDPKILDKGQYFCYINALRKKSNRITEYKHSLKQVLDHKLEHKTVSPFRWYGAYYFDMIQVKHKKSTQYVLLGVDKSNPMLSKKVIEVCVLKKNGEARLGKDYFHKAKRFFKRQVFLYNPSSYFAIHFQKEQNRLVFNHLTPEFDFAQGQYQFYIPDLSFDAFDFDKGKWMYKEAVEFKGEINQKIAPPLIQEKKLYAPNTPNK